MYREHFHLTHSPFAEEPDPEVFFPGAKREEICQSLILDVLAGKQLIKLVGREGAGKTLICQLIVDRLPSEYEVIHVENPVGSFDDLLQVACIDLGMDPRGKHDPALYLEEFQRLLDWKRSERIKVVLIIDEAEKLFLATLERLVRHIGDKESQNLTVLLAGRPELEANLDQLTVFCTTVDIHSGYFLEDLTENETRQYLRFRLNAAGMSREQHDEIFTEAAVAQIFEVSRGNVRKTNILAEEALQASCTEKSFMVLLDHVEPEEPETENGFRLENKIIEIYELLQYNKFLTGALAGAVVAVLLIGFLLMGRSGKEPPPSTQMAGNQAAVSPSTEVASSVSGSVGVRAASTGGAEKRDGEKIFRERLAASASWLAGIHKGNYTIQLMMLVSDQAQASVTNTFIQDEYYPIRDQLYVLRKKNTPPAIFVYYGMYDSLEAAREARNNMPVFLRKNHPYPLAVSDALKKLEN
ncbi:AAA family ATPase [uncultured Desulfobulbus sp.]|uniref:ExeA family protein n=1 Tax=uncultured Desulfobulbus sp. TaxID=239745 RepID=UPI0029C67790|nr:AAA family ATPase [uncultured Desulfobulbus sp.]